MRFKRLAVFLLVFALVAVAPLSHVVMAAGSSGVHDPALDTPPGTVGANDAASVTSDSGGVLPVAGDRPRVTALADLSTVAKSSDSKSNGSENGTVWDDSTDGEAGSISSVRLTVETAQNTSNYLSIPNEDVQRDDHARGSLDMMGALDRDVIDIRAEYDARSFEYTYEATAEENKTALIESEFDRIDARIQPLYDRQQRAIETYNAGEWSTRRFLRELVAINATASGLLTRIDRVKRTIEPDKRVEFRSRINALRARLAPLHGTVRSQVGEAMQGDRDPLVVYTVTSETGVVTAALTDGFFYRDAYLGKNYAGSGPNQFISDDDPAGVNAAIARIEELYPWVVENGVWEDMSTPRGPGIYVSTVPHRHGILEVYLDGRTRNAFHESQLKSLDALPIGSRSSVSDSLRLQANVTHASGPMELRVTDAETGDPVNATVLVDGTRVGSTDADGKLWTIAPQGSVRVVARTPDGNTTRLSVVSG